MTANIDQDAVIAAVDLVGRAGAKQFEVGYLHDDVPTEEAGWYATATYRGAKIMEQDHPGPVEACEALARRLLTGAKCTGCGGLVALSDGGAVAAKSATMIDGSTWTAEEARAAGQCRWRRMGDRWVRGCDGQQQRPNRAERRRRRRRR
jgi:hypothetical protein